MILRLYVHLCGYRHWTTVTLSPANVLEDDTPPKHRCPARSIDNPMLLEPVRLVGQFDVSAFDGWYE